jgi:hypothetical protein
MKQTISSALMRMRMMMAKKEKGKRNRLYLGVRASLPPPFVSKIIPRPLFVSNPAKGMSNPPRAKSTGFGFFFFFFFSLFPLSQDLL